jgi:GT2 family glycosyltransferase
MKIGIGVTGCNRPEHVQMCLDEIARNSTYEYKLHVNIDTEKRGVAWNKNQCLEALKDCDHIFLFDDDCFPRAKGWEDFFIDKAKEYNQHHFIYQHETIGVRQVKVINDIAEYDNANGCMMYFTREALDKIGNFDEAFGVYGFEHADMSIRAHLHGLSMFAFQCPIGSAQYIYSLDLDNYLKYNEQVDHQSTLFPSELKQAVEVSRKKFQDKHKEYEQMLNQNQDNHD